MLTHSPPSVVQPQPPSHPPGPEDVFCRHPPASTPSTRLPPTGRRQISSDYVLRSIDGRHMDVAAAIETFVTNKAGDAGSSCKVKHVACASSWSRESLRHSMLTGGGRGRGCKREGDVTNKPRTMGETRVDGFMVDGLMD